MRFAYYDRLSPAQQRIYRASDAIESVPIPEGAPLAPLVSRIERALASQRQEQVREACQALSDELCARLRVPPVAVAVLAVRPRLRDGDLYGLYEPGARGASARVSLWMRTARHGKVVAFRTFLRTLVHEFCHHLDYEHFRLPETFHTEGFYRRESSLMRQLLPPAPGGTLR
ncbi:MAG TPA: hypothetical protein VNK67_03815 [Burkholderiales bacterium]|nr:hypothetical protein [Burkholderiales bacterium]